MNCYVPRSVYYSLRYVVGYACARFCRVFEKLGRLKTKLVLAVSKTIGQHLPCLGVEGWGLTTDD